MDSPHCHTASQVTFCGETLLLDPAGVLVWPRLNMLVVADLHLEKGSACAAKGQLVPPWDTGLTLRRLATLVAHHRPETVVALGDSFHDAKGSERLSEEDAGLLVRLASASRFIWISGNHDPAPPAGLPGFATELWRAGPLLFRHQARKPGAAPDGTGEISGHFHPKIRVGTRAGDIVRPCFMSDADKLILPAFGAYTGGLDVGHDAIASLFPGGGRAWALGRDRLFGFTIKREPPLPASPGLKRHAPASARPLASPAEAHNLS